MWRVKSINRLIIHGRNINSDTATATILGTIVNVISLICVTAWNMEMIKPTTSPKTNIGAATNSVTVSASRAIAMTVCGVISNPLYTRNDSTNDFTSRYQPSTSTNNSSLNGNETIIGGSIIIPIDISTDATTISMTRNGMKMTKAI
jgi:hypothetical protein